MIGHDLTFNFSQKINSLTDSPSKNNQQIHRRFYIIERKREENLRVNNSRVARKNTAIKYQNHGTVTFLYYVSMYVLDRTIICILSIAFHRVGGFECKYDMIFKNINI